MAKKIKGIVAQFGTKGYGFITGDDGEKYFIHQKNIFDKSRLKVNTRVVFSAQNSEKGWVAMDVNLEKGAKIPSSESKPLSNGVVKGMFIILFIIQVIVVYKIFI
ncbi:cold-shock DNA-binding domain protein [Abyssogena phaseoliformis symbiont OG214]|uniref:cold-shock protein n=1 Tax=Abyssogena phaseoliformis symbiont TaxID=596095 RepID=UPI0019157910|nr:cold shock domain-containing protein [Abyssogena phaseoliformis symbiont]MBW5288950.1 cold-shock DNA-binding domain protein [Candidatus Ruthia sp. Apha_13_S6]BBB22815.1 cold-shock DNA-binding domain protein [Abyssogena phaseoliformis symbiont OG214]